MSDDFDARERALNAKLGRLNTRLSLIKKEITKVEGGLRRVANDREQSRRLAILDAKLSVRIGLARLDVIKLTEEAKREDISVARSKELSRTLIPQAVAELQKLCGHPIVCGITGYEGSYSYDYEDRRGAWRKCCVCGLEEYSCDWRGNEFKILGLAADRYVNDGYDGDPRHKDLLPWAKLIEFCRMSIIEMWDFIQKNKKKSDSK